MKFPVISNEEREDLKRWGQLFDSTPAPAPRQQQTRAQQLATLRSAMPDGTDDEMLNFAADLGETFSTETKQQFPPRGQVRISGTATTPHDADAGDLCADPQGEIDNFVGPIENHPNYDKATGKLIAPNRKSKLQHYLELQKELGFMPSSEEVNFAAMADGAFCAGEIEKNQIIVAAAAFQEKIDLARANGDEFSAGYFAQQLKEHVKNLRHR